MWGQPPSAVRGAQPGWNHFCRLGPQKASCRSLGPPGRLSLHDSQLAFRLLRFQYKYPGTPISTIAVPQNA